MHTPSLSVAIRSVTGKKVADLRTQGQIPAVVYGHGTENTNISIAYVPFEKLYKEAGESSLIDLSIEGKPLVKVLVHGIQRDPSSYRFTHVDFYQVRMDEKLHTTIPLKFVGESKAMKELGGILVKSMDELEVRCLPADLVHEIEVDIAALQTFEDMISVGDIKLPKGIEVMNELEAGIATVSEPISQEELDALDTKVEENIDAVKVEEKGKKEGE